jgi:hypothetical protein
MVALLLFSLSPKDGLNIRFGNTHVTFLNRAHEGCL